MTRIQRNHSPSNAARRNAVQAPRQQAATQSRPATGGNKVRQDWARDVFEPVAGAAVGMAQRTRLSDAQVVRRAQRSQESIPVDTRYPDAVRPVTDHSAQIDNLRKKAHRGEEARDHAKKYDSAATRAALQAGQTVYPVEDEAHVNGKVRTTYARIVPGSNTLVVSLDNAGYKTEGFKGFSKRERNFAEDMARFAKEQGLTVLFMSHVPPTSPKSVGSMMLDGGPGKKAEVRQRVADQVRWMNDLRRLNPDALWLHGHTHPDHTQTLDLNGAAGGREVSNLVLGPEKKGIVTKISTYDGGRVIEEYKLRMVDGVPQLGLVGTVATDRNGKRVDGAALEALRAGTPKGVFYASADQHSSNIIQRYYQAIGADAAGEKARGAAVSYLDLGDHTMEPGTDPFALSGALPDAQNYFWAVGNHDYYNHRRMQEVVELFGSGLAVDYVRGRGARSSDS